MLVLWSSLAGVELDAAQQTKFFAHPATLALSKYAVCDLVRAADEVASPGRLRLDDWLQRVSGPTDSQRPVKDTENGKASGVTVTPPRRRATTTRTPLRSSDKLLPQRPVDWQLAKKIGPVQHYDDSF
jgi:hypothetical protein